MSERQLQVIIADHIIGFKSGRLTLEECKANIKKDLEYFEHSKK
jgi:hypothetical protein